MILKMRKLFYEFLFIGCILLPGPMKILAQKVDQHDAAAIAGNYLHSRIPELSISYGEAFLDSQDTLAWVFHCQPMGFIIISANQYLPPILAWSTEGDFAEGEAWENFLTIFRLDLKTRIQFAKPEAQESNLNLQKWVYWMNPASKGWKFEQWPPEGWSSTGGWLFTNWTQNSPYNALCPIDGQTHIRSFAGCPAIAMAQIVNFHHDIKQTRFSDDDDYYHNFGTGNKYWIDNDWANYGFPSWDQLNEHLDTLETHYMNGISLNNTDNAALTYACGAAAKQVYSSSVSGTYGIDQAYEAFIRFGYSDAQLVYPADTSLNTRLAGNIKLALPAQLGLVNPGGTAGHNVVVDGYNTDELFHFNFGWGGSGNGWYTMPPSSIPYNLTVIEGIVLDINLSFPPVGLEPGIQDDLQPEIFYISDAGELRIVLPETISVTYVSVFDNAGRMIISSSVDHGNSQFSINLPTNRLVRGIYIVRLVTENGRSFSLKFVR